MAVLEKIRVKFGILITVLVALALLSFILDPTTLRSAFDRFSSDNKVGTMNGKSVSYKEFYEELNTYTEIAKMMGQNPSSEEQQAQLRDAAWQSIFDNEVFIPKAEAAGLSVGEEEMLDLTQGNNISPVLLQQGLFLGRDGNFSRETVVDFVQSIDSDDSGNSAAYWSFLEEGVFRNQLYAKYASLLEKSDVLSDLEKSRLVADGNVTADVDFVFEPISFVTDSTVKVSSEEIRRYFNDHKEQFKQPANRDIEYVMWEVVPSAQDYADTKAEVTPEFQQTAFHAPVGTVSPVVTEDKAYAAMRVADVRMMADSAHVYYKVYPYSQEAEADVFVNDQLRKTDISQFTEMGWITQDFILANGLNELDAVFDSPQKVFKVKNVNNQAILAVYVPERTKALKKVQVATLMKNVLPSDETYRDFQMKAVEFADACDGKYENFQKLSQEQNLPVIPINNMLQTNRRIGPADNAREVVSWVFDKKTKAGQVSDLKIVDNKYYFVTAVTKVRKEGYADIQDVASDISSLLQARKTVAVKLDEVKEKIAGLTTLEQISFGSTQFNQNDPALVGAVAAAPEGTIQTVGGNVGVYVFEVSNRTSGNFFSENDAATQLARKASWHNSILQSVIANEADIKDNRARFF